MSGFIVYQLRINRVYHSTKHYYIIQLFSWYTVPQNTRSTTSLLCDIAQKIAQIEREDYWSKYSLPKNYQIYLSTYIQEYFRAHQFKVHRFSKHYVNMIVTGVMWKPITIKEINKGSMRGTVTYSNLSSASRQRVALNLENLVMMSAILCSPWTLVQRVRTLAVLFSNSFSPTT